MPRCPQELRQRAGAGDEALRLFCHFGLLEMVDEVGGRLVLRLAHRIQNVSLGDPAEVVGGGRRPAGVAHVKGEHTGKLVGVAQLLRPWIVYLADGVEGQAGAMREQRLEGSVPDPVRGTGMGWSWRPA